jgi:hypothetical protein
VHRSTHTDDASFESGIMDQLSTRLTISSWHKVLEGDQEAEIVRLLLRLRDALGRVDPEQGLSAPAEAARAEVINLVNNFFYEKLTAIPTINAYMEDIKETGD